MWNSLTVGKVIEGDTGSYEITDITPIGQGAQASVYR